jgi:hypothetical protein
MRVTGTGTITLTHISPHHPHRAHRLLPKWAEPVMFCASTNCREARMRYALAFTSPGLMPSHDQH